MFLFLMKGCVAYMDNVNKISIGKNYNFKHFEKCLDLNFLICYHILNSSS